METAQGYAITLDNESSPGFTSTRRKTAQIYSSGLRNSNPNSRMSPAASCLSTLAAIGGVSLGTKLDEAGDGAGTVR